MNQIDQNYQSIKPHKYPLLIILFAGFIASITIYSLVLLPEYVTSSRNLHKAEIEYKNENYSIALKYYILVLEKVPSSKKARIGAATVLFKYNDIEKDKMALEILREISLNNTEWSEIIKVMPVQYQKYFTSRNK